MVSKKSAVAALAVGVILIAAYLMGSFVSWSLNPGEWDMGIRLVVVGIAAFFSLVSIDLIHDHD